jgi:hypothetical protein
MCQNIVKCTCGAVFLQRKIHRNVLRDIYRLPCYTHTFVSHVARCVIYSIRRKSITYYVCSERVGGAVLFFYDRNHCSNSR